MKDKSTIRKEKGVEICSNLLFAGKARREIIEEITGSYKCSVASIDNWIKWARPDVAKRQAAANELHRREDAEAAQALAKRLNISKERLMEELAKVAYGDVRNVLTVDGGMKSTSDWDDDIAGASSAIERYEEKARDGETPGTVRKVKTWDKIRAIEALSKMLGYNAPEKGQIDLTTNGQPINNTFVIKRRSDRKDS